MRVCDNCFMEVDVLPSETKVTQGSITYGPKDLCSVCLDAMVNFNADTLKKEKGTKPAKRVKPT